MEPIEWTEFTVSIPLNVNKEKIIAAWESQHQLERWFLRKAEFTDKNGSVRSSSEKIQPGDKYSWRWYGWPDNVEEHGEVLKPKEEEFIRFQFGKAGVVSLEITEKHEQQILQLTQQQIPADDQSKMNFYVGCKTGWTFYLLNLKSVLLGGVDLRNKDNDLHMD